GGVQFDAGDLGAVPLPLHVDAGDVVVGDGRERRTEVADDARLLAVPDRVAAHRVRADVVPMPRVRLAGLGPAQGQGPLDNLAFALRTAFGALRSGGPLVPPRAGLLAQGEADVLRVGDRVVLDHPALGPVRADQALL